jgi:RNA polymerase sigma-70 factor, ECF subfamily
MIDLWPHSSKHYIPKAGVMQTPTAPEVTQLLRAWSAGDAAALAQLVPLVEAELHRLARHYLAGERAGLSLQASDLVNEAYLRLIDWQTAQWQNRAHFFGVAAQLMRRILVDHARRRLNQKRGGDVLRVSLTGAGNIAQENSASIIALDDALTTLASFDPRKCQIVELKFFGGLSEAEIVEVTKLPLRTVQREWNLARAWLYNELRK